MSRWWAAVLAKAIMAVIITVVIAACAQSNDRSQVETSAADAEVQTPTAIATTEAPGAATATAAEVAATPTALAVPSPAPTVAVPTATTAPGPTASQVVVAEPAKPTVAPTPNLSAQALVANGGEVYTFTCARCHGDNGTGNIWGGLIGVGSRYTTVGMIEELTNGHPITFGFAGKLTPNEIESVVAYVKASFP